MATTRQIIKDEGGQLLQYWYTQSVVGEGPQGLGVYEQVMMAPRLEGRFGTEKMGIGIAEIGDPPRLATPEPGMGWGLFMLLVVAVVAKGIGYAREALEEK